MDLIFISGIFLSFFIVVLLLTKKQKALTDKILAAWFVIIGIHLLGFYYNQKGYWEIYPHLIGVTAPFPLLHGPMLFLYTLYSLRSDRKLRLVDYLHFAPAIAAYLYMSNFFFFYTAQEKIMLDKGKIPDYHVFSIVLLVAILISGLSYSILSYRLTIKHKQKIENNFSYREGINIKWLRYSILSIGLVFLSATIIIVVRDTFGFRFSFNADYIIYLIIIGFVFNIGYYGIKQENIFTNNPLSENSLEKETGKAEKYKNSGLKNEIVTELYKKLLKILTDEKPYLDPKLSLAGLAQLLEISPNQLSQLINQEAQVNFHDFVNNYRVEEFIARASVNKNFSLLSPVVIALFFMLPNKELRKDFLVRFFNFKSIKREYILITFFLMLLSILAAQAISLLFGYSTTQFELRGAFTFTSALFPVWFLLIAAPMLEELAWHSYGTDSLFSRFNLFNVCMIFAVYWAFWHFPLSFIKGYYHSNLVESGLLYSLNFLVSMIPIVLILNWLYFKTNRNILLPVVFHITAGFFNEIFATHPMSKVIQTGLLLIVSVYLVITDREMFFKRI